jgi:hypothetical protein
MGHRFLEQLKRAIMTSGISLEATHVDAEGMKALQNLLVKAGFNPQEAQEMMSDLASKRTGKGVTLATFFARVTQLSKPNTDNDMPVLLEISSLPYIETILAQLGMDRESIRSVLADAKMEGQGIDIRKLAANIRRATAADNHLMKTIPGSPNDVIGMMNRIGLHESKTHSLMATLEKMISELSGLAKKGAVSMEEEGTADEVSGDLIVSYLQQFAASLGDDGKKIMQLIDSDGKDNTGLDIEALLAKLNGIRKELSTMSPASAAWGTAGLSGASEEAGRQGDMSLSRFVAALEDRILAEQNIRGTLVRETSGQSTAEAVGKFLEKISSEQSGSQSKVPSLLIAEQYLEKQGITRDSRQTLEKTFAGANGKDAQAQMTLAATRQASSGGDSGGNAAENFSGKGEAAKLMDALAAAGKDRGKKRAEQNLPATDGFLRAAKSADKVVSSVKMQTGRTLPGYLLDQVSRQIVKLRTAGENEITLQLKPPHLGRMKLNVEHTSGGIKVGIVVESAAAKEMLLSHTSDLKAALGDQGLRLDKIDVETQSDFGRSMAQADREFGRSGGKNSRQTGHGTIGGGFTSDKTARVETIRGVDGGRLDLVA